MPRNCVIAFNAGVVEASGPEERKDIAHGDVGGDFAFAYAKVHRSIELSGFLDCMRGRA